MLNNNLPPLCRQCPLQCFELVPVPKRSGSSRFMAICHALEVVLRPIFPDNKLEDALLFINKANIQNVQFEPVDNCPYLDKLREEGQIPWAMATINFLSKKNQPANHSYLESFQINSKSEKS